MLFVGDELPASLVRIIEFLNEQMTPRKSWASKFASSVRRSTWRGRGTRWTRDSFLAELDAHPRPPGVSAFVRSLLEHVDGKGAKLSWGSGRAPGVGGWYVLNGRPTGCWTLNISDGSAGSKPTLVLYLGDIVKHASDPHVNAVAEGLEGIPAARDGIADARAHAWNKWPGIPLAGLAADPAHAEAVIAALDVLASPEWASVDGPAADGRSAEDSLDTGGGPA